MTLFLTPQALLLAGRFVKVDDIDAQRAVNRMRPLPSQEHADAISTLVSTLKTTGWWANIAVFYMLAMHSKQACGVDLRGDGAHDVEPHDGIEFHEFDACVLRSGASLDTLRADDLPYGNKFINVGTITDPSTSTLQPPTFGSQHTYLKTRGSNRAGPGLTDPGNINNGVNGYIEFTTPTSAANTFFDLLSYRSSTADTAQYPTFKNGSGGSYTGVIRSDGRANPSVNFSLFGFTSYPLEDVPLRYALAGTNNSYASNTTRRAQLLAAINAYLTAVGAPATWTH